MKLVVDEDEAARLLTETAEHEASVQLKDGGLDVGNDVHLMDLYAYEIADLVKQRKVSPVQVVEACLERIESRDEILNSFVYIAKDKALSEAKKQEMTLARGGFLGVLAGVPVAVKDLQDAKGMPTSSGVLPLVHHIATEDSIHVARLKAAGAIIIGKTNTPAFGYTCITKNRAFGVCRNPFDLSKSPGGSSGGSAAAVAGRLVPLATSTDGGGSIRIPATLCGVFGVKPTRGLIPRPAPRIQEKRMQNWLQVTYEGPTARCVKDAALYMHVCSGYHSLDPSSIPYTPETHPDTSFLRLVEDGGPGNHASPSLFPKRLNIAFSMSLGIVPELESEIEHTIRIAIKSIQGNLKHRVTELSDSELELPDFQEDWSRHIQAQTYEALRETSLVTNPKERDSLDRSFTKPWKGIESGGQKNYVDSLGDLSKKIGENDFKLAKLFDKYDLLITPVVPYYHFPAEGPLPTTINGHAASPNIISGILMPFNYSGHPSCVIRAGMVKNHGMKDVKTNRQLEMPVGFQVVAQRHQDFKLLAFALQYEKLSNPFKQWPEFPFLSSSKAEAKRGTISHRSDADSSRL